MLQHRVILSTGQKSRRTKAIFTKLVYIIYILNWLQCEICYGSTKRTPQNVHLLTANELYTWSNDIITAESAYQYSPRDACLVCFICAIICFFKDVKGVRGFWLTAFKNVDLLGSMIQEHDEPVLEHLTNVKVEFSAQPMVSILTSYKLITVGCPENSCTPYWIT